MAGACDTTLSGSVSVPLTGLSALSMSLSVTLTGVSASLSVDAETGEPTSAGTESLVGGLAGDAERSAYVGPGGAERAGPSDMGRGLPSVSLSPEERQAGATQGLDALEVGSGRGHGCASRTDRFIGRSHRRRAPRRTRDSAESRRASQSATLCREVMNDVPLPFALPPPDTTPAKPVRHLRAPADRRPPTPEQHTDLPLPLCGNGGSSRRAVHAAEAATLRELLNHLDRLLTVPAAPPLDDVDWRTVQRWAEEAGRGLVSRSEGLKLVRQVERVLANESHTAMLVRHANERIAQRLALAEERAAGTHWKRRDAGRRAKQPIHVDVDPAAWRRAKATAAKNGMTIGHYVGTLVRTAADRGLPEFDAYASTVRLFARLTVDKPVWDSFRACCNVRGVTIARGVGLVVESVS